MTSVSIRRLGELQEKKLKSVQILYQVLSTGDAQLRFPPTLSRLREVYLIVNQSVFIYIADTRSTCVII